MLVQVRAEQAQLRPDPDATITGAVLNEMVYTRQVVKEVLRFRPPAPMVPQVCPAIFRLCTSKYQLTKHWNRRVCCFFAVLAVSECRLHMPQEANGQKAFKVQQGQLNHCPSRSSSARRMCSLICIVFLICDPRACDGNMALSPARRPLVDPVIIMTIPVLLHAIFQ